MQTSSVLKQPLLEPLLDQTNLESEHQMEPHSGAQLSDIETFWPTKIDWTNSIIITTTPIIAVGAAIYYVSNYGFMWQDLISFFALYFLVGFSVTAGYHRCFSHRAYDSHPVLQFLMLFFGAAAVENSALAWSSDHRYHHRYTDREGDPYNINKGFFWAHMGWIYFSPIKKRTYNNVADLKKNRLVAWQHKYYIPIALVSGIAVPLAIGFALGRPGAALVWGFLVRLVASHHATFLINSAAHWFGTKPYDPNSTARDSWWLAYFSYGEGYHNYHHAYPSDYRNGRNWWEFDPTKWLIFTASKLGLAQNLRRSRLK